MSSINLQHADGGQTSCEIDSTDVVTISGPDGTVKTSFSLEGVDKVWLGETVTIEVTPEPITEQPAVEAAETPPAPTSAPLSASVDLEPGQATGTQPADATEHAIDLDQPPAL